MTTDVPNVKWSPIVGVQVQTSVENNFRRSGWYSNKYRVTKVNLLTLSSIKKF